MAEVATFRYEAMDGSGKKVSGTLDALSEGEASRRLASQGLTPYAMKAVRKGGWTGPRRRTASSRELQLVLNQFTTLLEAGVGLVTSLSSLAKSSHHPSLTRAFSEMERSVRRGESFSAALRAAKLPIPEYLHQLVHAGEATGRLAESVRNGVQQFEYDQRVRQEMTGAMIYPIVLVGSGLAAVGIIFMWVVPRFGGLLTQQGNNMPALSRWTIATGVWLSEHAWLVALAVVLLAVGVRALFKLPGFVDRLAESTVRLPIVGQWLIESEVGRWASTLAALLDGRAWAGVDARLALAVGAGGCRGGAGSGGGAVVLAAGRDRPQRCAAGAVSGVVPVRGLRGAAGSMAWFAQARLSASLGCCRPGGAGRLCGDHPGSLGGDYRRCA
ncbi:type II secretion system F family protein [Lysobacter avium]|uniref:Type II secretion system F family protein n=1 Tax=Novilysobacter avium TaxID=2781023 RepID=A0A7S6UJY6_9GAMM|nr:type II secretion system F family protein [Lysobacter avium]QOW21687.1 type II secretion system F family protein [Lysobacter avium]